jgi:high-affinity Fe2+/Pb2+ permease
VKEYTLSICSGILLMILSVWGGSFLYDYFGKSSWQAFPTILTTLTLIALGLGLVIDGLDKKDGVE